MAAGVLIAAAALLAASCQPPATGNHAAAAERASRGAESVMRRLDFRHPSLAIPVEAVAPGDNRKFVVVELSAVANPGREALSFEVRFRPRQGAERVLGTFSPFPPDNPGRFIVATQGKADAAGEILLSLQPSGSGDLHAVGAVVARVGFGSG
jgi:hypothetical protein